MRKRKPAMHFTQSVERGDPIRRKLWAGNQPPVKLSVVLPAAIAERIDERADAAGLSVSKTIRAMLEEILDRPDPS